MLTKDQIKEIQDWGIEPAILDKIIAAIKAPGETSIEGLPKGKLFTEEVLTARDMQMKEEGLKEGKTFGFKEGKEAGLDIHGKAVLKKFNIDPATVNSKDPDKVAEAIHGSAAKGDAGLQEQIKLLQADKEKFARDLEASSKAHEAAKFDSTLITSFPIKRNPKLLNDEEYLSAIKTNLQFENSDGVMVVKKGTEILRHPTTKAPLPLKEAIESYFVERNWIEKEDKKPDGGRGGGDNLPGGVPAGIRTASQFEAQWKKENPNKIYGQPESVAALMAAMKAAGPGNFDMNS